MNLKKGGRAALQRAPLRDMAMQGVEARTLHNWTAVLDEVRQRVAEHGSEAYAWFVQLGQNLIHE